MLAPDSLFFFKSGDFIEVQYNHELQVTRPYAITNLGLSISLHLSCPQTNILPEHRDGGSGLALLGLRRDPWKDPDPISVSPEWIQCPGFEVYVLDGRSSKRVERRVTSSLYDVDGCLVSLQIPKHLVPAYFPLVEVFAPWSAFGARLPNAEGHRAGRHLSASAQRPSVHPLSGYRPFTTIWATCPPRRRLQSNL